MRKIIISTGYMGSGSSAITDLVSEFEDVNNKHRDFEYIFLHCPNGVFDLEDKLLVGNNSIRSDEAIHSFLKVMKDLYDKKFWWPGYYKKVIGEGFYDEVIRYVDSITDVKSKNYWYYQENPTKKMQIKSFFKIALERITKKKNLIKKPLLYDEMLLSYKSPEEFYKETRKFINNVFEMIDSSDKDLLLDQLLLPHNVFRLDNYFDDNVKVIIVERDPRDVFIINKYAWQKKGIDVPYSFDVKKFCRQYKDIRALEKQKDNKKVLRVKFEDLVYNYDVTEEKVRKFLGYSKESHVRKFERFNPNISICNTQVFSSSKEFEKETKYIEKELKEFLYPFPKKVESKIENTIN